MGLKYECLPNFYYWCGRGTYGERDCELWLRGKGSLKKEDQQFGEWFRANLVKITRRTITVVAGGSRSQATWWRKLGSKTDPTTTQSGAKIPQKSRFLAAIYLAAEIDKDDIMDDASSPARPQTR